MPKIDLIYDPDCPNVDHARARLRQAITEYGQPLQWTEWVSDDRSLPDYASGHGSPTILVDERDVSAAPARGRSCRMYEQPDGTLDPAPPVAAILAAFSRAL
jgi:hypothetical protein